MLEVNKQKENETYLKSAEWKNLLKKAKNAVCEDYTVIYRDSNGELKEAWQWLSEDQIEYVKSKFVKKGWEVLFFIPKELPYGEYLRSIKGGSRNE